MCMQVLHFKAARHGCWHALVTIELTCDTLNVKLRRHEWQRQQSQQQSQQQQQQQQQQLASFDNCIILC